MRNLLITTQQFVCTPQAFYLN